MMIEPQSQATIRAARKPQNHDYREYRDFVHALQPIPQHMTHHVRTRRRPRNRKYIMYENKHTDSRPPNIAAKFTRTITALRLYL